MSKRKLIGLRIDSSLWTRFKVTVYSLGLDMTTVLSKMLELFVTDEEFRRQVAEKVGRPRRIATDQLLDKVMELAVKLANKHPEEPESKEIWMIWEDLYGY